MAILGRKKRNGVKSVLAFVFLPQFHKSFAHLSIIKPMFMRTIASLFEGSGLLPLRHPATLYGAVGVKKYTFFELMGEAYYNLKNDKINNPYKWSVFLSVVAMTFIIFISIVMTVISLASVLMSTAQAQLFDHIHGHATGMDSVPTATGGGGFNMNVTAVNESSSSVDYGIMILNKLFREGIVGSGGGVQHAFGSLMQVYNSAILMIAGIMLFWAIISIVVDAAKTGQVGGGRHNLVWAPIRIVFALGLLIPLGSSGFSSGQLMMIKLAEWGSNLGTRAWVTYVDNITNHYKVVADYQVENSVGNIDAYIDIWTCRAAFNGMLSTTMGDQYGTSSEIIKGTPIFTSNGNIALNFGNSYKNNLCGSIITPLPDGNVGNTQLGNAALKYQLTMLKAFINPFINADNPSGNEFQDSNGGYLYPYSNEIGCMLASTLIAAEKSLKDENPDPLIVSGACKEGYGEEAGATGEPGSGSKRFTPIDTSVIKRLRISYISNISNTQKEALREYQRVMDDDISRESLKRGWPAMSLWYMNIAGMNQTASEIDSLQVTVNGPSYQASGASENMKETLDNVFALSDQWWKGVRKVVNNPNSEEQELLSATKASGQGVGGSSIISDIMDLGMDIMAAGFSGSLTSVLNKSFFTQILNVTLYPVSKLMGFSVRASDTYPLAELAAAGSKMEKAAMRGYFIMTGLEMSGALVGVWFKGAELVYNKVKGKKGKALDIQRTVKWVFDAIIDGPIGSLVTGISHTLLMGSFMYSYYIPLLPFLKVAMAVLTWIIAIFEAVVMLPIAALSHITTEGDGLVVNKTAWVMWLNLLLRPILTVIGFVGSLIVLQTMVIYADYMWTETIGTIKTAQIGGGELKYVGDVAHIVTYVAFMYAIVNASFKLIDIIPDAFFKYMGTGGTTSAGDVGWSGMSASFNPKHGETGGLIKEDENEAPDGSGAEADTYNRSKAGRFEYRKPKSEAQMRGEAPDIPEDKKDPAPTGTQAPSKRGDKDMLNVMKDMREILFDMRND